MIEACPLQGCRQRETKAQVHDAELVTGQALTQRYQALDLQEVQGRVEGWWLLSPAGSCSIHSVQHDDAGCVLDGEHNAITRQAHST